MKRLLSLCLLIIFAVVTTPPTQARTSSLFAQVIQDSQYLSLLVTNDCQGWELWHRLGYEYSVGIYTELANGRRILLDRAQDPALSSGVFSASEQILFKHTGNMIVAGRAESAPGVWENVEYIYDVSFCRQVDETVGILPQS